MSLNYRKGELLSGIIYLHNITDHRIDGSSPTCLRVYQKLCGQRSLKNVLLTTTQWSSVPQAQGERRETDLRSGNFCGRLLEKGATLTRFMGTRESGLELIHKLMKKEPKPLDIQNEMVEQSMTLLETAAGNFNNDELISLTNERKFIDKELLSLQEKLLKDLEDLKSQLQKAENERDKSLSFSERVCPGGEVVGS